jgi:hypothetical protein
MCFMYFNFFHFYADACSGLHQMHRRIKESFNVAGQHLSSRFDRRRTNGGVCECSDSF